MLRCEILDVQGFDPAIHGMRNPKNSWDKSDSYDAVDCGKCGLIEEKGVCNKEDRLGRCDNFRCYAVGDNAPEADEDIIQCRNRTQKI